MIEDSDNDDSFAEDGDTRYQHHEEEVVDDVINSTPPREPATPGPLDEAFDAVFAPERDGKKRRRLGTSEDLNLAQKLQQPDSLPQLSPGPQEWPTAPLDSPDPRPTPGTIPQERSIQGTPAPRSKFMSSGVMTPGTTTKTPFRSKPRFMLSTKKAPNTPPVFRTNSPLVSQPASPPERRKPAFILPRSPSPSATAEDIPAPFSPSSRALRRRGRQRAGAETYTPGGMAAEVRSWILEMGSKREAIPNPILQPDQARQYMLTARVLCANQTTFGSSGPLSFIQAESTEGRASTREGPEIMHIMVMGQPRTKPSSWRIDDNRQFVVIQTGDLLGIHHGFAWNLEFHANQPPGSHSVPDEVLQTLPPASDFSSASKKDWLVAMEWDILES